MKEHLEELGIPLDIVSEDDFYDIPPWELSTPNVNITLHSTCKKDTSDFDYKQRFLEVNDSYEKKNFTSFYTDGSKSDNYVSASAVFSVDILKVNLPVHTSIFTAEAVALKLAVQCIQRQVVRKSVIYSDSLSCLQALENKNLHHPVIREIIQVLTYLNEVGSVIEFCWIPGHRTYATGAACQQRTLTPPDTWSCPTLGLACVLMSRPIFPELVLSPDL